jgi:glutaredoxin
MRRSPLLFRHVFGAAIVVAAFAVAAVPTRSVHARESGVSSLTSSPITVFDASWCSACRALERGLTERKITFETVDVDKNPDVFARARDAAGASNAIPLTRVVRSSNTVWVVGADVDAVDHAQRGD